jgi:membrane protein required for colicin V production
MPIDILFFLMILSAFYKGYNRGLIVALFSFAAAIIGLAAAVKLSAVVAVWLQNHAQLNGTWLPLLSFLVVIVGIFLLVKIAATMLEKTVEFMLMGWVNKLGGMLLYALLYSMVFSVILFFLTQLHIFSNETIANSKSYEYIEPYGPIVISGLGKVIPIFKDVFQQLEAFFAKAVH